MFSPVSSSFGPWRHRSIHVLVNRDTGCAHSHDRKTEIRFPAECTDRKIIPSRAGEVVQTRNHSFLSYYPFLRHSRASFARYRSPAKVFLFNEATHFHLLLLDPRRIQSRGVLRGRMEFSRVADKGKFLHYLTESLNDLRKLNLSVSGHY